MKKRIICFLTVTIMLICALPSVSFAVGDVIDFTRDSINLFPDEKYQLTLKSVVDNAQYRSSDPNIAAVSETGMVSALKAGSSIITVTDTKGNQATCTVTVRSGTAPKTISLETQSLEMTVGDVHELKASVVPEDIEDTRLFFSSTDTTIAKVDDNGVIKALSPGVAVINIESASTAVTRRCMVKVSAQQGHGTFNIAINGVLYTIAGDKKANMVVELKNDVTELRTTTNKTGQFYFESVVQGSYTMNIYKSQTSKAAAATGKLTVDAHDMNMSCIINGKELVILYQNDVAGTGSIKDITLEKNNINIEVGSSYDMSFRLNPSNAALPVMKGVSRDPDIATVDIDGRITGISEGTTKITFTTSDGKFSKTCKVNVISSSRSTYSWIIIFIETTIIVFIVIFFIISYRRFRINKEREEGVLPPVKKRDSK